jgi:hypothetical protein
MALLDYGTKRKDKDSDFKDANFKTIGALVVGVAACVGALYYTVMRSPVTQTDFELAEAINQEDAEARNEFTSDPNEFHGHLFDKPKKEQVSYVKHNPYKDDSYIQSAIWHESKTLDDGYNRPCVDVKITYTSGDERIYKEVPIKGRFGSKEMCLEWHREAQWAFENGTEQKFLEDHDYKYSTRRKVDASDDF